MKNRKLLLIVSLVLALTMSLGGTLAYLTDTDADVNTMVLGNVKIEQHEYQRVKNEDGTYKTDNIDDQTSYVLEPFEQDKMLLPTTEIDENGNPVNNGAGSWDPTRVRMTQVDSYGTMDVFVSKNAQDKFVTVENTGKTDAYVRTLVAIEIGSGDASLIGTSYHTNWEKNDIGEIEIEGQNYYLVEYTYKGASDNSRHVNGVLPAGETTYPNLSQVYIKSIADNDDLIALDGNGNGKLDILVVSQAVQAGGFANAKTALDTAFGVVSKESHPWKDGEDGNQEPTVVMVNVATNEELTAALNNTEATVINVTLEKDMTVDVAAWQHAAMGGDETKTITINGNGNTLTFNQTNSDWNNIATNGAKLVLNNVNITNAGHNDGPWNRHDINFACDVELNNVTSDKALAFKAGAKLTNVTISDANTSDTYAIWIQPKGQTVTLDGCTIDMLACTDGRGIKIDEQYVSTPAKVTLVVKDTTFKTEEKSAILVKSVAGADITLSNVDISGVAVDSTNAVWVDSAAADSYNLVTVTGGSKVQEQ